jgi:parallel beta-helix repeat protein
LGVQAVDATGSTIAGNLIAYNLSDGIVVGFTGSGNRITGNSIFANGGLGIDLGSGGVNDFHGDGVTSNDPGDSDIGPNNLMNFPVLTFAKATPGQLVVKGTIDTPNPKTVTLEFFANPVPTPGGDLSGHGEGAVFLGRVRPNGQGHFTASLPRVRRGTLISATATDAAGNTSEFSANIAAQRAAGDDDH